MKKILTASVVGLLAFATVAAAQGTTFSTNLTVGSKGADVVALQTWLIANGYSIPSIASGAAAKGYFGAQTKAAVVKYQTAVGLPSTGFVGPLTRAKLNGGAVAVAPVTCPVGQSCGGTVAGPTGITTPGIAGTLDLSNGSIVGNGTAVNDGQEVDLGSIALQTGASDMAITSTSVDFNVRPWLYMTSLQIRDVNGKVLAQVDNLNQNMFSEITVGSDYRLTIPLNLVVPKATKIYTVLHGMFASSNRTATSIAITRADVRAVDGTGVTLTSTLGPVATTVMYVAYGGQQGSSIIVTTDASSPKTGTVVQTSTGTTQTQNVLLGVFDLKSQNINSTLQGLTVRVSTVGGTVGSTFAFVQLKSGSTLLNTGSATSTSGQVADYTFSNFNLALPSNVYVPVSVYATVNGNVNGVTASSSLVVLNANITGLDNSSNNLTTSSTGTIPGGGVISLNLSGSSLTGLAWNISPTAPGGTSNKYPSQTLFTGSFTVSAGNNPIYISKTGGTALTLATTSSSAVVLTDSVTVFAPADGVQSWDGTSVYTINAGTSRTFNVTGSLALGAGVASTTQVLVSVGATSVNLNSASDLGVGTAIPVTTQLTGLNSDFSRGSVYLNGSL